MEGYLGRNQSKEVICKIKDKIHETTSSVDELSLRWEETDKQFGYISDLLEEKAKEVNLKEESLSERIGEVEERERKIRLLEDTIIEKLGALEEKENEIDLKQVLEASILRMALETENEEVVKQLKAEEKKLGLFESSMMKKYEELMSEVETAKDEIERKQTAELERKRKEAEMMEESHKKLEEREKEITEIMDINEDDEDTETFDEDDEAPEAPFDCPDADFNDFNKKMNSFAVGQIWALYADKDVMPRFYAQVKKIFKETLQVKWLEPVKTTEDDESLLPIACGKYRYGKAEITNYSMFSHEMHHIKLNKSTFILNPRIGETWALFRDWNTRKSKPSYMLDFVEIVHDFEDGLGVGVMYLGKVEGFVSVYNHAAQHGVVAFMIPPEEMGRFSHKVPSFKMIGEVNKGVPDGSFELDPAAISAYIHNDPEAQSKDCGKEAHVVEKQDGSRKDLAIILD